jgi:uncharacterized DUF497 family protein
VEFEWDPEKAEGNLEKHGVSFTEAATVFGDPLELTIPDPDHSECEARVLSLGQSAEARVLVLGEANPKERRTYESDQNPTA